MSVDGELSARLRSHRLLEDIPAEEISWVAERGRVREMEAGEVVSSRNTSLLEELLIILSGRISAWVDRGSGLRKVTDWVAGDISGRLPYSRQTASAGEVRVEEPAEIVTLHRDLFPAMIRECPALTTRLVQLMLDRARLFTRHDLHNEKMMSLGRLAAGLAHELDNPASAMVRSAKLLIPAVEDTGAAAQALGARGLSAEQLAVVLAVRGESLASELQPPSSNLELAMREEAVLDWLESRGIASTNSEALGLLNIATLDSLAETLEPEALEMAIRWIAAEAEARKLAEGLARAAARISNLVQAVKGFTQMDAAAVPQPVEVEPSLSQTVSMLQAKAGSRSAVVSISVAPECPPVHAVGGELNQVWMHLLDNALDAIAEGGTVRISAVPEGERVVVIFVDDGRGIPPDIQDRIFDPFFTTKPVGGGTGLGLDIARRLVLQQGGSIEFSSTPGRTEFRVLLPAARHAG